MTAPRRYRALPLEGLAAPEMGRPGNPDQRAHGVQVGGSGGRIIGDGWGLDRIAAERIAEELQTAYEAGMEEGVEA